LLKQQQQEAPGHFCLPACLAVIHHGFCGRPKVSDNSLTGTAGGKRESLSVAATAQPAITKLSNDSDMQREWLIRECLLPDPCFLKLTATVRGRLDKIGASISPGNPMQSDLNPQPPLIERIERALVLLAYFIELDGNVHLPMYEKFEAELQDLKDREDAKARARRRLMAYSDVGGLRAIR
jgi:hypothetical protein